MPEPQPVNDGISDEGEEHPDIGDTKSDGPGEFRALQAAAPGAQKRPAPAATGRPASITDTLAMSASQLCTIGYFARIVFDPLERLVRRIASGVMPFRMTSASAEPQICAALTSAQPGLKTG